MSPLTCTDGCGTERAWSLLTWISSEYRRILGDGLTGVYAHGSLAFGCFRWEISDIDFLVVTRWEPTLGQKRLMMEALLSRDADAPAKGFEMSVVPESDCLRAAHPAAYSLHYSNTYRERCRADTAAYCRAMNGLDPDLIAHFAVTRAVGRTMCGKPIGEVFGSVRRRDYLDSIRRDLCDAEETAVRHPVYAILNMARALAYRREGLILSKARGGEWGIEHIPEAKEVIRRALDAYTADGVFPAPKEDAKAFLRNGLNELMLEDES